MTFYNVSYSKKHGFLYLEFFCNPFESLISFWSSKKLFIHLLSFLQEDIAKYFYFELGPLFF